MTLYIIAQLIGFAGYLFYIGAPHLKTQTRIIQADAVAGIFIGLQWYLLEQPALLGYSLLSIIVASMTLKAQTNLTVQKYLFLLYPLGGVVLILMSQNIVIGVLAITAFCLNVASKSSCDITSFRKYATASGSVLTIAGILTLSIPAVLFNLLFASGHILKLWKGVRAKNTTRKYEKASQAFAGQPFTQ
ncbi:MAG: hypothetical protein COB36_07705 [Alphaproteobacteria bacterium]|nr:MAG: hypothetical protein COB36_07705 [Alphaproteobacteria bacterium]